MKQKSIKLNMPWIEQGYMKSEYEKGTLSVTSSMTYHVKGTTKNPVSCLPIGGVESVELIFHKWNMNTSIQMLKDSCDEKSFES